MGGSRGRKSSTEVKVALKGKNWEGEINGLIWELFRKQNYRGTMQLTGGKEVESEETGSEWVLVSPLLGKWRTQKKAAELVRWGNRSTFWAVMKQLFLCVCVLTWDLLWLFRLWRNLPFLGREERFPPGHQDFGPRGSHLARKKFLLQEAVIQNMDLTFTEKLWKWRYFC